MIHIVIGCYIFRIICDWINKNHKCLTNKNNLKINPDFNIILIIIGKNIIDILILKIKLSSSHQ